MNCLVWNYCGFGNLCTRKKLGDIIWSKDSSVMFITETLVDEARLDIVQQNINFDHKWVVLRVGHGGGLVLFWKSLVNLEVVDSLRYYIDMWIDKGSENEWSFIGFYGKLDT